MKKPAATKCFNERGITLTELVVVMVVLSILSTISMPLIRMTVKREKEAELRADLREMRDAIDEYKKLYDEGRIAQASGTQTSVTDNAPTGYPPTLKTLTRLIPLQVPPGALATAMLSQPAGGSAVGAAAQQFPKAIRLLRKIPVDPMTGKAKWGMRSNADDPESTVWGGQDVFDVYSLSSGTALDGTKYADW